MDALTPPVERLVRRDAPTLAYRRLSGRGPGLVFLPGFRSDMRGSKATALLEWARETGRAALLFDYRGHGSSDGNFTDGTIGQWVQDALTMFDQLTEGPQLIVGSSMGGWVALHLLRARAARIKAMVGIAAAPDFTERLIRPNLTEEQRESLAREGQFLEPSTYDFDPTPITAALLEDGQHRNVLDRPLPFTGPVRLLHGLEDRDVPWELSLETARAIEGPDVRVVLVKDGDHRLSRPQDLDLLRRTVEELLA